MKGSQIGQKSGDQDSNQFQVLHLEGEIILGENSYEFSNYRCLLNDVGDFIFEIGAETPLEKFSQSTLLTILDIAEENSAKFVYVAFKNDTQQLEKFMKLLIFIGFKLMSPLEMQKLDICKTHIVLKYLLDDANSTDNTLSSDGD